MHLIDESEVKDIVKNLETRKLHYPYRDASVSTYYKSTGNNLLDMVPLEYHSLLELRKTAEELIEINDDDKKLLDKLLIISMKARVKMEVELDSAPKDPGLPTFVYAF